MTSSIAIGPDAAAQIAAFSRVALPYDMLSTASVLRSVFEDPDPQTVLATYDAGLEAVGAGVVRGTRGFVKLLAVHPRVQLRGVGSHLLERIESFCRSNGATSMEVGSSAPRYVVPGIDVRATEALCFFASRGYERCGDAVNQRVRLADLPEPALPCRVATAEDHDRILPWVRETFPHWIDELERAMAMGTCVVHRDLGFACYDVNRDAWFGPMATRPGSGTRGVGTATLLAALHGMRARGYEHADIAWSGPLLFYLKAVGARVSRVFWWYRKDL